MEFVFLFSLLFCHLLGDFVLSNSWMLKAKQVGKPLFPIFVHAWIHGTLMGCVLFFFAPTRMALFLVFIQVITHFSIDVLKGKSNVWIPDLADPRNKFHWWVFGLDQLLHQTIIIIMIWTVYTWPNL